MAVYILKRENYIKKYRRQADYSDRDCCSREKEQLLRFEEQKNTTSGEETDLISWNDSDNKESNVSRDNINTISTRKIYYKIILDCTFKNLETVKQEVAPNVRIDFYLSLNILDNLQNKFRTMLNTLRITQINEESSDWFEYAEEDNHVLINIIINTFSQVSKPCYTYTEEDIHSGEYINISTKTLTAERDDFLKNLNLIDESERVAKIHEIERLIENPVFRYCIEDISKFKEQIRDMDYKLLLWEERRLRNILSESRPHFFQQMSNYVNYYSDGNCCIS